MNNPMNMLQQFKTLAENFSKMQKNPRDAVQELLNSGQMTQQQYIRICAQLQIVKDVLEEYGNRTIENAIQTLEARKKWYEENQKEERQ